MADISDTEAKTTPADVEDDKKETASDDGFVHGAHLTALTVSLMLGMFLVALDNVR